MDEKKTIDYSSVLRASGGDPDKRVIEIDKLKCAPRKRG